MVCHSILGPTLCFIHIDFNIIVTVQFDQRVVKLIYVPVLSGAKCEVNYFLIHTNRII